MKIEEIKVSLNMHEAKLLWRILGSLTDTEIKHMGVSDIGRASLRDMYYKLALFFGYFDE